MKSTQYSDKTLEHFREPRNVGTLEGDDVAVGRVGNPVCGDLMDMYIRVQDDRIVDIRFQTFGCGSAVATSSMTTELVKGMTLDEALDVTRKDVADALDGLPPVKMHCSNLAADALHEAVKNWREGISPDLEPVEPSTGGCLTQAPDIIAFDDYLGVGAHVLVSDPAALADRRVIVLDRGDESAQLALDLTEHTPRVIFMVMGRDLTLSGDVATRIKRSDVKILFESLLLEVAGEGEVERVRVHDLNEDEEYELFVDAVVDLGGKPG